jgi:hypothetical protein
MRRIVLVALLAALLAGAAAGSALAAGAGVELTNGAGRAVISLRGAVLGTLQRGRITIRLNGVKTEVHIDGKNLRQRTLADGRVVYSGRNLRFRVFKGSWRVVIDGAGINASAGGRGLVNVRGSGRYSIDGAAPVSWTLEWQAIRLAPLARGTR